jgi:hypothetical protein
VADAWISQLVGKGVITRVERSSYGLQSAPNVVRSLRERGNEPRDFRRARTALVEERVALTRMDRQADEVIE